MNPAEYVKAIGGAIAAGAAALSAALLDGHITNAEWITIAVSILGSFGVVFTVPNAAAKPAGPPDREVKPVDVTLPADPVTTAAPAPGVTPPAV